MGLGKHKGYRVLEPWDIYTTLEHGEELVKGFKGGGEKGKGKAPWKGTGHRWGGEGHKVKKGKR